MSNNTGFSASLFKGSKDLATQSSYKHAEAFCWMYYANKELTFGRWIFNSRDGVTPFITFIDGVEVVHTAFRHDLRVPQYQPREGDLVWRDTTVQEAVEFMERQLTRSPLYNEMNAEYIQGCLDHAAKQAEEFHQPSLAIVQNGAMILYRLATPRP
ncbi:MAG TPA: hypothetical protein VEY71_07050 [Chitinophagales bacterium]|nr:hypothetical protein [Chitinophagales bacterium]